MLTDQICQILLQDSPWGDHIREAVQQQEVKAQVEARLAVSHYPYRQLLLTPGQPAEHIYFVQKGFVRGYHYEEKADRQISLFLWDERSVVAAANSFFLKKPSDIYIEVMPGSILLSLSRSQVDEIYALCPASERLGQGILLQYKAFHKKRTLKLLTLSAWERYLDLLQTHPRIEQKVSKDIIASYLGITPQSLSRLLKENRHP